MTVTVAHGLGLGTLAGTLSGLALARGPPGRGRGLPGGGWLGLLPDEGDNRRVLAVLRYLGS